MNLEDNSTYSCPKKNYCNNPRHTSNRVYLYRSRKVGKNMQYNT